MASNRRPLVTTSRGVTLVELMIALVVIAIGIMALSGVQTRSSTDVYATGRRTRALSVAQTQLEETRAAGYVGAVSDTGQTDGFDWVAVVDSANIDLRRISVTVRWTEGMTADSLRLVSMVSRR